MIKDLVNIELDEMPIAGLDIHIIKKYTVTAAFGESFCISNFSILLIKSGKFTIKLKNIVHDLRERDLLIIPRNCDCSVLGLEEKLQLYLISFSSKFAIRNGLKKEVVDSFNYIIAKTTLTISLDEKEFLVLSLIYKLIYFINNDARENGADTALYRTSFSLYLYQLRLIYAKYSSEISFILNRKENLIVQFLTVLAVNYKKQHSAQFYAGALFVTEGHLNKIVRQVTGQTVKKLIIENIIAEAENLLDDLQLSISDIADELEFPSANSFTVFFKKNTSISPSQYRINAMKKYRTH